LEDGEIAINQADGKLYYRTAGGGVSSLAGTIVDGSVTIANIADGSITSAKIADGAVATVDIANSAVTYAKIQNVSATDRILGRSTAGAGVVEEIVCTAFGRSVLDDVDAAATRTTLGLGTAATAASTSFAASSHTHAATEIVSGVLADARLSANVVLTTDSRLSDARTPTSHVHGNITNAGAIGTVSGQIVVTGSSGVLTTAATIAATAVTGLATVATTGSYNDLTNKPSIPSAYTLPTASATVLGGVKIGSGISIDGTGVISASASYTLPSATTATLGGVIVGTGLGVTSGTISVTYGTTAGTACQGNDSRLSDARTPLAHTQAASTITGLATVATSGSFTDLTNQPTIPTFGRFLALL